MAASIVLHLRYRRIQGAAGRCSVRFLIWVNAGSRVGRHAAHETDGIGWVRVRVRVSLLERVLCWQEPG